MMEVRSWDGRTLLGWIRVNLPSSVARVTLPMAPKYNGRGRPEFPRLDLDVALYQSEPGNRYRALVSGHSIETLRRVSGFKENIMLTLGTAYNMADMCVNCGQTYAHHHGLACTLSGGVFSKLLTHPGPAVVASVEHTPGQPGPRKPVPALPVEVHHTAEFSADAAWEAVRALSRGS